jgi:protein ImuB
MTGSAPPPLWLALAFPSLALQRALRALDPALARTMALAVVDGPAQRQQVLAASSAARAAGVAPGMGLAAAQALARGLVAVRRQAARERETIFELAGWAGQFSSQVLALPAAAGEGVVLETGGSERLFGGRVALRRRIGRSLATLGFAASAGAAPTARGAWWIARARLRGIAARDAHDPQALRAAIAPLPLDLPAWEEGAVAALRALGLANLGEVLALPRDSLSRRFGPGLLEDLDRALGLRPDPQAPFTAPERFHARIELPADLTEGAQLACAARRLLASLEGWLRARNAAAARIVLRVHHGTRRGRAVAPTEVELSLALPERDGERLARLLDERLARLALPGSARELELIVEHPQAFPASNASLLPPAVQPGERDEGCLRLAETLHARMGEGRVFALQVREDHRPECGYRVVEVDARLSPAQRAGERPGERVGVSGIRPLLLLPCPRALPEDEGPLSLLAGPERIEAGWWAQEGAQGAAQDAHAGVQRDYYVARTPRGQLLWIYRDLVPPGNWFVHGLFA